MAFRLSGKTVLESEGAVCSRKTAREPDFVPNMGDLLRNVRNMGARVYIQNQTPSYNIDDVLVRCTVREILANIVPCSILANRSLQLWCGKIWIIFLNIRCESTFIR